MEKYDSNSDKMISKFKVFPEPKDIEKNNGAQSDMSKMEKRKHQTLFPQV